MNKKFKIYLVSLYIFALLSYIFSFILYKNGNMLGLGQFSPSGLLIFIVLEALGESIIIKYSQITISTAFAVTTAGIFCFGGLGALIIVSFGVAFRCIKHNGKYIHIFNTPIYKTLFNVSNMTISTFISSYAYYNFLGNVANASIIALFIKYIVLNFTFLVINSMIISMLVYLLSQGQSYKSIMINNLKIGFLNIVFISPLGIILAFVYLYFNVWGVLFLIIPIILLKNIFQIYIQ